MTFEKEPNRALVRVVTQAGMSNTGLASRVRVEAKQRGIDASPDHVSVKRWLDGTRPHDDTIRCIAAVLSAKLGREISFAEIGYEVTAQRSQIDVVEDGARYPAEVARAVELLDTLTSADMADSPEVMRSDWVSETAPGVIRGYLFSSPVWQDGQNSLITADAAAERIRVFTRHLMDLDFNYGGVMSARCSCFTSDLKSSRCCESRIRTRSVVRFLVPRPKWRSCLAGALMTRGGTVPRNGISCKAFA